MPMTGVQLEEARRWIGDIPDDGTLSDSFDRLGSVYQVVLELIMQRRADLINSPAQFTVEGEYRQNTSKNIDATTALLYELYGVGPEGVDSAGTGSGIQDPSIKRLVRDWDPWAGR